VPNWQPDWEDVRWNYVAADRAAAELDRAAGELESTSDARRQVADTSAAEWRGAYRRRFDQQLTETLRAAWWQAGEFRDAAARIRRATQWARDEQLRRERERERWRREKADEDARHAREQRARQERARQAAAQAGP
jgi:hypothetical protein